MGEDFSSARRLGPDLEFERGLADDLIPGIAGDAGEAVVDVEVRAVGKNVNGEAVRAETKSGREEMLGVGEGAFGLEKIFGNAALFAIGEDEADGGAEEGSRDGDPGNGKLIAGQITAHEEDEKGNDDGEAVGDSEIAEGGDRFGDGIAGGVGPGGGQENHSEAGKEKKKVSPACGAESGFESEQIVRIRNHGQEKHTGEAERKGTQAGGDGVAGAEEETEGKQSVTDDVEDQDLAGDVRGVGQPAGRGVEEIEIGGEGDDGDLGKIKNAEPIPTTRFFIANGKKHHEYGSGPDKKENVGGHREIRRTGNVALVVGGDGLGEGFDGEGDREERPELASVTLRATGRVERGESGEKDDAEIEGVGEEVARFRVADGDEVKKEERRYEEGEGDEELGKLALGLQADLRGRAWRCGPGNGLAARGSVHQRGVKKRDMFTKL